MYEQELQNLGLGEKEAAVYLAALELGPETAQNLAKKALVNRATAYVQIESLKDKGLMSEFEKGKKTYYAAESPERLSAMLRKLEASLVAKKSSLNNVLPLLLSSFAGMGERPKVRFFEGMEGASAMRQEFLGVKNKNIEGITNMDKLLGMFPGHESDYSTQRIKKKIKSRIIYTRKQGHLKNFNDNSKLRQAKFIQYDKVPLSADITIFDNKISFVTYESKPVGVVVENKEIADSLRALFNFLWESI